MTNIKLYEHITDGGAIYYGVYPEGAEFFNGVIMRTDGGEIEIFTSKLHEFGIDLVIN